jgi:hypothetical protein
MNMPENAWYWIICLGAIVLLVAIWRGRGIKIRFGGREAELGAKQRTGITVGNDLTIKNSHVGHITGQTGTKDSVQEGPIEVLSGATIEGSVVGDISGIKVEKRN